MGVYLSFTPGRSYRWKNLAFYAMNGVICLTDERDGSFQIKSLREWAHMVESHRVEREKCQSSENSAYVNDRRRELQEFLEKAIGCYHEAKDQGDHNDPVVSAWFRRHRPWAGNSVSMSGVSVGLPAGVRAGSIHDAVRALGNRAGLSRGRFNPGKESIRPDRSVAARPARRQRLPRLF